MSKFDQWKRKVTRQRASKLRGCSQPADEYFIVNKSRSIGAGSDLPVAVRRQALPQIETAELIARSRRQRIYWYCSKDTVGKAARCQSMGHVALRQERLLSLRPDVIHLCRQTCIDGYYM